MVGSWPLVDTGLCTLIQWGLIHFLVTGHITGSLNLSRTTARTRLRSGQWLTAVWGWWSLLFFFPAFLQEQSTTQFLLQGIWLGQALLMSREILTGAELLGCRYHDLSGPEPSRPSDSDLLTTYNSILHSTAQLRLFYVFTFGIYLFYQYCCTSGPDWTSQSMNSLSHFCLGVL